LGESTTHNRPLTEKQMCMLVACGNVQTKSFTFDERGLDASRQRQDRLMGGFTPLKKAMTFVDKNQAVQADVFGYQDILYRTLFNSSRALLCVVFNRVCFTVLA